METKKCNICKIRAYIKCEQCSIPTYFCSRGHLYSHKMKTHRAMSANNLSKPRAPQQGQGYISPQSQIPSQPPQVDMRKLYEHLQNTKKEIINKMTSFKFNEAIELLIKSLNLSRKFYQEDHPFNIELLYTLSECYFNTSNLDQAKVQLESIINLTEASSSPPPTNLIFRYKANMLLGAISLNLGDYSAALRAYTQCEENLPNICKEPELNVKLSSLYLNFGICYIYLSNPNIAEKYLKKGLTQTEGILGNDTVHKLNADLFENLGLLYEQNLKFRESMVYYKKSLKLKFGLYGENHDEVLELQYKISSVYVSMKQYKEAEEILSSMTDVVLKEKINYATQETIYRYASYFYTFGVVLIKMNKLNIGKFYLLKSKDILEGFLSNDDPLFGNISNLIKVCDRGNKK